LQWYQKSAAQDHPQGRVGYGIALVLRAGTQEAFQEALTQFHRAAAAGLPAAHYLLGLAAEGALG
jgi:TPR repeat protein